MHTLHSIQVCQKLYAGIILVERTHRVNNDGKGILKIPSHAVRSLEREQRWQEGINNTLSRHTSIVNALLPSLFPLEGAYGVTGYF